MQHRYSAAEAGARARALYEARIRAKVEPHRIGDYLVMDLNTGEYVLGGDLLAASDEAAARFPDGIRFAMRVGYRGVDRIGGRLEPIAR